LKELIGTLRNGNGFNATIKRKLQKSSSMFLD
jgi:hypothetical protein